MLSPRVAANAAHACPSVASHVSLSPSHASKWSYDRQAIDMIYNGSVDIASTDPVQQVCNDAEADAADDTGVNPICILSC